MNLDGKRSVNNILSSFCAEENESVNCHLLSVETTPNNDNSTEVVLDSFKHFTVSKISISVN